jgi:hypothetical protein
LGFSHCTTAAAHRLPLEAYHGRPGAGNPDQRGGAIERTGLAVSLRGVVTLPRQSRGIRNVSRQDRTCRRELLDHVIVFGERHLRRLLAECVAYYNADRVHTRLGDSTEGRPIESRPSPTASVVGVPRLGSLHHRYVWAEAA